MKEQILSTMETLGFQLQNIHDCTYAFDYEHWHLLMIYNEEDPEFIQFSVPFLLERGDVSDEKFAELMNQCNSDFKYLKCYETNGGLSLFYELHLGSANDLEDTIEHIIRWLELGATRASLLCSQASREFSGKEGGNDEQGEDAEPTAQN